jgi:RNA polymerase sigma factor (sigma-70 family)
MLTPDRWTGAHELAPPAEPRVPLAWQREGEADEGPAEDCAQDADADEDSAEDLDVASDAVAPQGIACSLDNAALAQLVGRIVRQDEAAMAALYDSLCGRVYAVALHITGQIGSAEEVLQDTFWQVWRQAPRFDAARGSAIAWIMTLARSRALDARRAGGRELLQSRSTAFGDGDAFADAHAADPLDLLDTVQRDTALHATLATLDPLRRQLIALVFYRGLTHDEIATHTGLPLGTVKSHLRRALITLREALGPDFNSGRCEVPP